LQDRNLVLVVKTSRSATASTPGLLRYGLPWHVWPLRLLG